MLGGSVSKLAISYVYRLLARRDYSEYQIRCKMQAKAFSEQEIEEALAFFQGKNWQSDLRFAENYLYSRANKGYGLARIKQELKQKGVQSDVIQIALELVEIDWFALAKKTLSKKFPNYQCTKDIKQKQKIWRYMLSHGFNSEQFAEFIGVEEDD